MGMIIVGMICITILLICEGSNLIDTYGQYKNKKLEEEHKTTNLALIYQILSARPELSLDEVIYLVDHKENLPKVEQSLDN